MIKTLITPHDNKYTLSIPENYIGKKVEILVYSLDEVNEEKKPKKSLADFCGILSENEYLALKEHTEQARDEWNRDI